MRTISNRVFARGRIPAAVAASAALAAGALGAGPASAKTTAHASAGISATFGFISTTPNMTGPLGFAYKHGQLQKWLAPYGVSTLNFDIVCSRCLFLFVAVLVVLGRSVGCRLHVSTRPRRRAPHLLAG